MKRDTKALKSAIVRETAINIGFAYAVINKLPIYALTEAIKQSAWMINKDTPDHEVTNIIVTESVRFMNYQDFKEIADYFFQSK